MFLHRILMVDGMKLRSSLCCLALASLLAILAVSCSTVSAGSRVSGLGMMNEVSQDPSLELGEKLDILGYERIEMTFPTVYNDGSQWKDRLVRMLEDTQDYFICTVFLGSECDLNQDVFDTMKAKAQAGVDVYVVIDSSSSLDMTESRYHMRTLYDLRDYGVHLFEYNRMSANRIPWVFNLFYREHRKFFVSDGVHVAVGGMNMNYISMSSIEDGGDRDAMYVFDSPSCAKKLTDDFVEFWNRYSWEEISSLGLDSGVLETDAVADNAVEDGSNEGALISGWIANQTNGGEIAPMYGAVMAQAKEEILMLPFLPTLDSDMYAAVEACTSNGVKFEMILRNDDRASLLNASKYATKDLLDAGVEVWMEDPSAYTNGSLLHEKLVIIDERYVICGSSNFNYRSLHISSEITLVIDSPELAMQLKEHYLEIQDYSNQVSYEQASKWHTLLRKLYFIINYFGG